jgi:biotin transporter BioY
VMAAALKVDLITATNYSTPFLPGDLIKVALTVVIAFGLNRAYPKAFKN